MSGWKSALVAALIPTAVALAQTSQTSQAQPPPAAAATAAKPAAAEPAAEKPPNPPRPLDQRRVARGKDVYQRFCLSCHGENGDGRGYSSQWLNPQPRDFTRAIVPLHSQRHAAGGRRPDAHAAGPLPHQHAPPGRCWAMATSTTRSSTSRPSRRAERKRAPATPSPTRPSPPTAPTRARRASRSCGNTDQDPWSRKSSAPAVAFRCR